MPTISKISRSTLTPMKLSRRLTKRAQTNSRRGPALLAGPRCVGLCLTLAHNADRVGGASIRLVDLTILFDIGACPWRDDRGNDLRCQWRSHDHRGIVRHRRSRYAVR